MLGLYKDMQRILCSCISFVEEYEKIGRFPRTAMVTSVGANEVQCNYRPWDRANSAQGQ